MRDHDGTLSFDPRLPATWDNLRFRLCWRGRVLVTLTEEQIRLEVVDGDTEVPVTVRGTAYVVRPGEPLTVDLPDQGEAHRRPARRPSDRRRHAGRQQHDHGRVPEPIHAHDDFVDATGEIPVVLAEAPATGPHIPDLPGLVEDVWSSHTGHGDGCDSCRARLGPEDLP